MEKNEKHAVPLRCKIATKIISPSPSAIFCKCSLGRHHRTKRCVGCVANTEEIIVGSLFRGFEEGLKNPQPVKISADWKSIQIFRAKAAKEESET